MNPTTAHMLATAVVLVHLSYIGFVIAGAFLVLRWRKLSYLHLAAVVWAVYVEWGGATCPLTPLENNLRAAAGLDEYAGDFVAEYIFPVLYPNGLTRRTQLFIGGAVVMLNSCIYMMVLRRGRSTTFTS
jgi:hypothetical protein